MEENGFITENGIVIKYTGTDRDAVIPDGTVEIGKEAFADCGFLVSVSVPGTVKTVGDRAFIRCTALERADFSEGTERIGKEAFSGCAGLRYISLPGSVVSIGENAFSGCYSLKEELMPVIMGSGSGATGFLGKLREHPLRSVFDMMTAAIGNMFTYEDYAYIYLYKSGTGMLDSLKHVLSRNPEESAKAMTRILKRKPDPEIYEKSAGFICENSNLISAETVSAFYADAVVAKAKRAVAKLKDIVPGTAGK